MVPLIALWVLGIAYFAGYMKGYEVCDGEWARILTKQEYEETKEQIEEQYKAQDEYSFWAD